VWANITTDFINTYNRLPTLFCSLTQLKYTYVYNDPVNNIDPFGLFLNFLLGCAVSAGIEIAWQMLVEGKSLACVDWLSVAMSALEGCVGGMGSSKLAKLLKRVFGCNSFTADTLVHTENGLKPISEIKVGDKVLSYDERTETTHYQPVMAVIQGEQRYQLILITLDSGESIETTAEHPFYIKGKGWNPANSLKVGQALQLHNGTTVVIKEIDTWLISLSLLLPKPKPIKWIDKPPT